MKLFFLTCTLIFITLSLFSDPPQIIIGENLHGEQLLEYVVDNYKTSSTLGYDVSRDILYGEIDLQPGNQLSGVYCGYTITMDLSQDPSTYAYQNGINCEHTWPQSMGAGSEPQKSDMHHLFPCKSNVNSSRGNDPLLDIPDQNTDNWYRESQSQGTIPTSFIEEWAEKENDGVDCFEPRDAHKGDAARAMFYFYAMYQEAANENFFLIQKDNLKLWHYQDPVDDWEYARTNNIADYQEGFANPFCLDSTLVRRIWFYEEPSILYGDIDGNQLIQAFDASMVLQYSIGLQSDWEDWQLTAADVDGNDTIQAFDAALILQYTIGIITEFPVQGYRKSIGNCEISIIRNKDEVIFSSDKNLYSLEIETYTSDILNIDTNLLFENSENKLALASATPISGEFLKLKFSNTMSNEMSFNIVVNDGNYMQYILENENSISNCSDIEFKGLFPNPFNPHTTINFSLSKELFTTIQIYNVKGEKIMKLVSEKLSKGQHSFTWNGKDRNSKDVASGVYFFQISSPQNVQIHKALLLK